MKLAANTTIVLVRQTRFWRGGSHCSHRRDFMLGLLPHFTPLLDISPPTPLAKRSLWSKEEQTRNIFLISLKCNKRKPNQTKPKNHLNWVKIHLISEKHFYFWNNVFFFSSPLLEKAPPNILLLEEAILAILPVSLSNKLLILSGCIIHDIFVFFLCSLSTTIAKISGFRYQTEIR